MRFLLRISLFQISADGIQIGCSLCWRHSRFKVTQHHKNPMFVANVKEIHVAQLFLVHDRYKEIRRDKHQCALEVRRRHGDDSKRMLVYLNYSANHARVILKTRMPIRVRQNDIWNAVRSVLVAAVEEIAQIWLDV